MKFKINEKILEQFPEVKIAVIIAKGIDNTAKNEEIVTELKQKQEEIRKNFNKEELSAHPKIKPWREAYSKFGAKPKKYRSSIENLYKMTLEDIDLNHINTIVDIYNFISIKYMLPVGGDDLDHIDEKIELTIADGTEPFQQLNAEETTHPKEGEVIYKDNTDVLCRRWNWRECNKSKMTKETKNVSLVIEALSGTTDQELKAASDELKEKIETIFGIETQQFYLSKETSEIEF